MSKVNSIKLNFTSTQAQSLLYLISTSASTQPRPQLVIDRYGNFHLTDTDMLITNDGDAHTDTDKKKMNSPIPIPIKRKEIHQYRYRYEKLLDTYTDTNTIIF